MRYHLPIKFNCPNCKLNVRTKVLDSGTFTGGRVRRRRLCLNCKARFATIELTLPLYGHKTINAEDIFLIVPKKKLETFAQDLQEIMGQ